jgi:hypothetical protein
MQLSALLTKWHLETDVYRVNTETAIYGQRPGADPSLTVHERINPDNTLSLDFWFKLLRLVKSVALCNPRRLTALPGSHVAFPPA